jgi:hypothetical protein
MGAADAVERSTLQTPKALEDEVIETEISVPMEEIKSLPELKASFPVVMVAKYIGIVLLILFGACKFGTTTLNDHFSDLETVNCLNLYRLQYLFVYSH